MPEAAFVDPRLAALYDPLDPDRSDLVPYLDLAAELGARRVIDVGCGTGTFALLLAARGLDVVGLDPAPGMLAVARAKPGADAVRWILGDATALPPMAADLATMTANVAQVFTDDAAWLATLAGVRQALRPRGHLVLETRVPAARAWEGWTRAATWGRTDVAGVGTVEGWVDVTAVTDEPLVVSFRSTFVLPGGVVRHSDAELRFRSLDEVAASLTESGLVLVDVRDAPDRPGREHVVLARRPA